jgi:hypothetical protein
VDLSRAQRAALTLRRHPAATLTGAVATLTTFKVLAVAHGDPVTVAAVLSHQGFSGLASVAIVAGLPIFAIGLLLSGIQDVFEGVREADRLREPLIVLAVGALVGFALIPAGIYRLMVLYLVIQVVISAGMRFRRWQYARRGAPLPFLLQHDPRARNSPFLLVAAFVFGLLFLTFSDRPWMPMEKVTRASTSDALHGYVLGEGGDFLHVMLEADRSIAVVKASDINVRELCASQTWQQSYLFRLVWRESDRYQEC